MDQPAVTYFMGVSAYTVVDGVLLVCCALAAFLAKSMSTVFSLTYTCSPVFCSLHGFCSSRGSALSPRGLAHIIAQAAEGLAHIASKRMLHLDIKPANLLLSGVSGNKSGAAGDKAITVKVADMGLSILLEKAETSTAHR